MSMVSTSSGFPVAGFKESLPSPSPLLQGPFLDWFVTTANEYPLLWAVYALAIVSPFALIAACCVKSKVNISTDPVLQLFVVGLSPQFG